MTTLRDYLLGFSGEPLLVGIDLYNGVTSQDLKDNSYILPNDTIYVTADEWERLSNPAPLIAGVSYGYWDEHGVWHNRRWRG